MSPLFSHVSLGLALALALLAAPGCSSAPAGNHAGDASGPQGSGPPSETDSPDAGAPTFDPQELAVLATLSPPTLAPPPPDPSNAHADDPAAAALGQELFFDTGFSGKLIASADDGGAGTLGTVGQTGVVACVSCHDPKTNFTDDRSPGRQISLGTAWGRRPARSLLDVGQAKLLGWDGRHDTLYDFSVGALESPADMNSGRLFIAEQIYARYKTEYEAIFGAMPPMNDATRFPQMTAAQVGCGGSVTYTPEPTCTLVPHGVPGDMAEFDSIASYDDRTAVTQIAVNVGKSLGAYVRRLTSGPGRFDAWVHGQSDALDASEQRGAKVFIGPGLCTLCHSGPYFSDGAAHVVGLQPAAVSPSGYVDTNDQGAYVGIEQAIGDPLNITGQFSDGNDGRLPTTVSPSLNGAFFTPRLRGVALQPSYTHTGQFQQLADVVAFFNHGGDGSGFVGTIGIAPRDLSAQDQADLVAFLGSLTGPGPASSLRSAPQ